MTSACSGDAIDASEERAERTRVSNGVAVPGTEFDDDRDASPAILCGRRFRPRLVTVEAHPHLGGERDDVADERRRVGYGVIDETPIRPESDVVDFVAELPSAVD